jgi:hypothetical protein
VLTKPPVRTRSRPTIEYWFTLQELRQDKCLQAPSTPFDMAIVMFVTGLLLVFGIVTRLL